ncbi:MAG: hypothetical protein EXS03_06775 [Phycisphaerales bacterium]|nr:hypothetical protein [Phycisphaerales bacterium]
MAAKFRIALAVVIALVIASASVVVWCIETLGHMIYPPGRDLDLHDAEQVKAYMAALPPGAILGVLVGWLAGVFVGCKTACKISKVSPRTACGIFGGLFLAEVVSMLIMFPHPMWFAALSMVTVIGVVVLVAKRADVRVAK